MLTEKQINEIKCLDYFKKDISLYSNQINETLNYSAKIIESKGFSPEEAYFEITTKGIKEIVTVNKSRLYQLLDAKKWRLRHVSMYEQGILDGSVPYCVLLENTPKEVIDFLSVTMFKGIDKKLIIEFKGK